MIQYIEAPSEERSVYRNVLFLAGGISNCPDWQKDVVEELKDLPITIYNPRRKDFDITDSRQSIEQIQWEYFRLREATQILFWFPHETICPITLFEYGATLERKSKLFVGAHPMYQRILDLRIQTLLRDSYIVIESSVHDLVMGVRKFYERSI